MKSLLGFTIIVGSAVVGIVLQTAFNINTPSAYWFVGSIGGMVAMSILFWRE